MGLSLLARDINWMETSIGIDLAQLYSNPYSLGILTEWKRFTALPTYLMRSNPYSLGILTEWKQLRIGDRHFGEKYPYSLGILTEWKL